MCNSRSIEIKMQIDNQQNWKYFDRYLLTNISNRWNRYVIEAVGDTNLYKAVDTVFGSTLLHFATANGNYDIMKFLIKLGADVNAEDQFGTLPLMLSLKENGRVCLKTLKILLDANADIYLKNFDGISPLEMFLHEDYVRWDVLRLLFDKVNKDCRTVQEVVCVLSQVNCPVYHAILWKTPCITVSRLKEGWHVNCRDPKNGKTALHVAVELCDFDNAKLLLDYGADVNAKDLKDRTPLSNFNVNNGSDKNLNILRLLLARGAQLYECDSHYKMQVYEILRRGDRRMVKVLLDHGISLSKTDGHGDTAVHYLAKNENEGCIYQLQGRKFNVNFYTETNSSPLHVASQVGLIKNINFLLDNGAVINMLNDKSMTPLFYAVTPPLTWTRSKIELMKECVELLMLRGADLQCDGKISKTVFDIILSCGNYTMAKPILMHLAIQELLGTPSAKMILDSIYSHRYFRRNFNLYRRQLRLMQNTTISESITFFKFLAGTDRQIARYARNRNIVRRLIRMRTKCTSRSYCKQYLRRRVMKALRMARIEQQAIVALKDTINFGPGCYINVIERIVYFLNDHDIGNLLDVRK